MPLDQDNLFGGHPLDVLPFVTWVMTHIERLALSVRVPEHGYDEVILRIDAAIIIERERMVKGRVVDRSP